MTGDSAFAQSVPKWLPSINFEAKPGTKRSIGEADLFVPFAQTDTVLLFGNARARFNDDDNREGNVGLGLRHMLAGWNFGVYGYYDRKRSEFDHYFNQATFGIEALGRDFDFRANVYLPFGDRVKNVESLNTAALSGTNVLFYGGEERALRGFDAEIGWRVPVWPEDDSKALRLYAGIFHFDDSVVKAVTGPRLRAEFTMYEIPVLWEGTRLTLGAEYQHDDVRGSQAFAMARLSIPLQPPAKVIRLTPQERRMTDRVVRDVDIVSQAGAFGAPETVTQLANGNVFSVVNSAATAGNDLNAAINTAGVGSTVVLAGTFQTTGTVSLAFNQTLMGGAVDVRNAAGRTATLNTPASIIGTNVAAPATVQIPSGGALSGLTIASSYNNGSGGAAVRVNDFAGGVTILNNTISMTQSGASAGVALSFGGNTGGTVRGNTLTATGSGAATIMTALNINGGTTTATVAGNSMSASGGITNNMASVAGATINAESAGNVRGSGVCNGAPASGFIGFTDGTTCP
jgi:hypothetical protein